MSKQASPHSQLSTIKEIKANSFVFEKQQALPADLCEEMIRRFEQKQDQQYQGLVGQLQNKDQSIKQSTDIALSGKDDWKDIDRALFQSMGRQFVVA